MDKSRGTDCSLIFPVFLFTFFQSFIDLFYIIQVFINRYYIVKYKSV